MKINKFAFFAFVSCLNVLATVVDLNDPRIAQLRTALGIQYTPNGYVVSNNAALENLNPQVKNFYESQGYKNEGLTPLNQMPNEALTSVGITRNGNDYTIDTNKANAQVRNHINYMTNSYRDITSSNE
jgi:hypothetical protein